MEESRKNFYYLEKAGKALAFEHAVARIKGVTHAKVDEQALTLEYEIDEWTSDYDVFTEVMRVAAECGAVIDFDRTDASAEQVQEAEPEAQEQEVAVESEQEEEYVQPEKEEKSGKSDARKEFFQRIIELGVALAVFVVALFLQDTLQFVFLAVAFAVSGYEPLYEAIVKITKRCVFSEELLITLAFFGGVLLGYATYAVAAMLTYAVISFVKRYIGEAIMQKSPAWKQPAEVTVRTEEGTKVKPFGELEPEDAVSFTAGEICPFDGVALSDITVQSVAEEKRSVLAGEAVYAGERLLEQCEISVREIGSKRKWLALNEYTADALESKTGAASLLKGKYQIINAIVLAVCLIIAFIPPIFTKDYTDGLYRWGYTAIIIATVVGFGNYLFAEEINLIAGLLRAKRGGAVFGGYNAVSRIAKSSGCYIDKEGVLDAEDGNLSEDAAGAIRELKDSKVTQLTLVCSCDDEQAIEACKQLKIKEFYSNKTGEQKAAVMAEGLAGNNTVVISAADHKEHSAPVGATVYFDCESNGFKGDACLFGKQIAYLPFAVKLAKRTHGINKLNLVLSVAVKAIIVALAFVGVAQLWWAALADCVVAIICALNAFRNSGQIY